jgi:low temperature requirement protein LtrA
VAIGVGAAGHPLDAGEITAALLGVTVAACLWWSYFDWVIFVGQALLEDVTGADRAAFARDMYSYLHMPMMTGIALFALGLATTLAGDGDRLALVPAVGLCGGVALYLLAHVVVRLRMRGGLGRGRPIAAVLLLGLIPVATAVPAVVALGLVTATCVCLIVYEALHHRASRTWIRSRRGNFTLEEVRRIAENDRLRRSPGSDGSIDTGGETPSTGPA